jgi:hypothetical protein
MSWQAQTAVTHHSKQRNVARLRLLMYLAEVADASGLIDPAPNQETLADFIGCSTRSIRTMLSDLVADGELEQTRIGSGPGNPSAYRILLPMAEKELTPGADKGGRKVEANPDFLSTFEAFKAEVKAEISELKAEIFRLKVEKVEAKGGKGGSERWKHLSTESADDPSLIHFDPISIQEEGETPLPPAPPDPFPFRPSPKDDLPEHEGPADKRAKAIIQVCGLSADIPTHANKAANAAAQLREFSAGWILDRYGPDPPPGDGWHWYSNDWRGQRGDMPTPEQVVETIAKRKTAARPAPQANGRSRSRAEEAAVEYAQMRQEFFSNGQDTDDS